MKTRTLLPLVLSAALVATACQSTPKQDAPAATPSLSAVAADVVQQYLLGESLLQKGNYVEAIAPLTQAALAQYIPAEVALALNYAKGLGIAQNVGEANTWIQKAFSQDKSQVFDLLSKYVSNNDLEAKILLSVLKAKDGDTSTEGNGYGDLLKSALDQNKGQALDFLTKLADSNNAEAQMSLGDLFYIGEGVTQDYTKAADWFKKASDNNNLDSQLKLSEMLQAGLGVKQNEDAAIELLKKAAASEDTRALYSLGDLFLQKNDYAEALEWFSKAAKLGDVDAVKMVQQILQTTKK